MKTIEKRHMFYKLSILIMHDIYLALVQQAKDDVISSEVNYTCSTSLIGMKKYIFRQIEQIDSSSRGRQHLN